MPPKQRNKKIVVLNEEELIRQVSLRPILYDRSLKAYRKSGLRLQYWREVALAMNATNEECRRRWRSLRDAFAKHLKQANREANDGGEPPTKRRKWVFYEQMSFMASFLDNTGCEIDEHLLDDFADNSEDATMLLPTGDDCQDETHHELEESNTQQLTTVTTDSSVAVKQLTSKAESKFVDNLLQEDSTALSVQEADFLQLPEENTHVVARDVNESTLQAKDVALKVCYSCGSGSPSKCNEFDSEEKFLLSCAPALRRLSYRKNALARLKIQQILYEIEFDTNSNAS